MMMNLERHFSSQLDWLDDLRMGLFDKAAPTRAFYDEYYAVSDLPAEFFLDTVDRVFQRHLLAKGEFVWRGRQVDPGQIRDTPLLTIEGELDDLCPPGQTAAAHDLLTGLAPQMKHSHVQAGAGHYGVFSGRHWRDSIYPLFRDFVASASGDAKPARSKAA
jgi:polyhydroxyalkanoate depolymerase